MNKQKKSISILLTFCVLLTLLAGAGCEVPETPKVLGSLESVANEIAELSIDDIRRIANTGGQIYQTLRVYSETLEVTTYKVPIPHSEIKEFLDIHDNKTRSLNSTNTFPLPFPHT